MKHCTISPNTKRMETILKCTITHICLRDFWRHRYKLNYVYNFTLEIEPKGTLTLAWCGKRARNVCPPSYFQNSQQRDNSEEIAGFCIYVTSHLAAWWIYIRSPQQTPSITLLSSFKRQRIIIFTNAQQNEDKHDVPALCLALHGLPDLPSPGSLPRGM